MKVTSTHLLVMMIVTLLQVPVQAQDVKISLTELKEVFKKETDCNYCLKAYHFAHTMKRLTTMIHALPHVKPRKRQKKRKRLVKLLGNFIAHVQLEHTGLSQQLEFGKAEQRQQAVSKLIILNTYLKQMDQLLNHPTSELREVPDINTKHKELADTQKKISKTLITLKPLHHENK